MVGTDARFHAGETMGKIGKTDRNLATRQLLALYNRAFFIKASRMKTVLANVVANR